MSWNLETVALLFPESMTFHPPPPPLPPLFSVHPGDDHGKIGLNVFEPHASLLKRPKTLVIAIVIAFGLRRHILASSQLPPTSCRL